MRITTLIALLAAVFSSNVMAEKLTNTIDIINNSNLAATVTYNICTFNTDTNGMLLEKDCKEKIVLLQGKESGLNKVVIDAKFAPLNPAKQNPALDTEITSVYIAKIQSNLGQQTFVSSLNDLNGIFDDKNLILRGLHINVCSNMDYTSYAPTPGDTNNVIILDNHGTNKFYCHASSQA